MDKNENTKNKAWIVDFNLLEYQQKWNTAKITLKTNIIGEKHEKWNLKFEMFYEMENLAKFLRYVKKQHEQGNFKNVHWDRLLFI